ncbi:uncharacterized protein LOC9634615 [Selaginella moellendorffii]|nr:uncharacterized protein LOC9634615 [Selaginella moellendorffii]|eukprot:XP_002965563.2 uncharacterized protein LOC9634615 [Selaginella moellendorffii]
MALEQRNEGAMQRKKLEQQEQHSIELLDGQNRHPAIAIPRQAACDTLQSIIQAHFEKTLEKKRAVDAQKKELWRMFGIFFVFLAILFDGVARSSVIQCRHCWAPIGICLLATAIFYVGMAQTLKCINAFKYLRRCHKLTMGVATDKLRRITSSSMDLIREEEVEVRYQEPDDDYIGKFKRKWIMFTVFLALTLALLVSSFAQILCL